MFGWNGRQYEDADLIKIDTGEQQVPKIFVSSDYAEVFIETVTRNEGPQVHRVTDAQVQRLATHYQHPALEQAAVARASSP